MKAIIPVAGIGTRLQPITNSVPKVLVNVAGKPMLFHLIDEIISNGRIDTVVLIIGYLGEMIVEAVNKAYKSSPVKFEFIEQKEMLGLGHAVYHGAEFVGDEPVIIILGDTIFEFDLDSFISNNYSAIGYKDVEDVSRFGIVESENGFITRLIEKPAPGVTDSKSAIAGLYFIKNGAHLFRAIEHLMDNNIRTKNEYQLTDALMKMVEEGEKMIPFEIQNWFDCGKPETLLNTNTYILNRDHLEENEHEFVNTKLRQPVYIGVNCTIQNSEIGPNVTIADGVTVKDSKIVNSLICDGSTVTNAELENVIIGISDTIEGKQENIMKAGAEITGF
ncbi:MAG: NTP transferase domain-containing protein [Ignavibacteria bacterium]|nr:NTP transferase domain-containing protein [Ignavibacteria bacterium]